MSACRSRLAAFCLLLLAVVTTLLSPAGVAAFSVGEEKEVGEKLLAIVRREFTLLDDPDISSYFNQLGQQVLAVAGPQFFDYHFFVINNPEFNAFAAPSGLIFVHSGLLEAMHDEDELFSVLAHECGHVQSRHIADRIEKNTKMSIGTAALVLAGLAMGSGPLSEALIAGSMATGETLNLHFSRKDEEEADRLAFDWMLQSHRDPGAMQRMLGTMLKISKYRRGKLPAYLLTHPEPEYRLGYVQDLLAMPQTMKPSPPDPLIFQRIKARILSQTKDSATLRSRYQQQLSRDPHGIALYGLALADMAEARFAAGEKRLQQVIQQYPDHPILLADLGLLYLQAGERQKAINSLKLAHQRDPQDPYATFHLARAYAQDNAPQQALLLYQRLLAALPDYSRLYYNLGQLTARLGKRGEGLYYLGSYYWLEADSKKALTLLQQSVDLLPPGAMQQRAKKTIATIKRLEKE